jgi:hypothetical protein
MPETDFLQAISDHRDREPTMCPCGHPSVLHADRVGCMARWEHDSGSDVCPCDGSKYPAPGPDPRLEGADGAPPCSGAHPDAGPYWGNSTVDERPQAAYSRAVEAFIAHAATHATAWNLPCRTCRDLRAAETAALVALRRSR